MARLAMIRCGRDQLHLASELANHAAGMTIARRRPSIAVLLAPGRPALANAGFGSLIERKRSDLDPYGYGCVRCGSLLIDNIDARRTVIAFTRRRTARFERSGADESAGVAERVGFEPTVRFPAHTLSKRAP
jgi:hypothetical protein